MRKHRPVLDRFWAFVQQGDGCWEWTGYVRPNGYGQFGIDRETGEYAHRMAYQIAVGPIPRGLYVCHRCDTPRCVRPDHLFLGTQFDNMRDAATKGRVGIDPWTHCKYGHEFTPENTAVDPKSGHRRCRICHARNGFAYRERDAEKTLTGPVQMT